MSGLCLGECGELLCEKRFSLKLKGVVHESYVRPAMLHRSEAWYLKESEMGIFQKTEIQGESNVWSTAQRWRKI